MKKVVKWIIMILIVAGIAGGAYYYTTMPLSVETVSIKPGEANIYFIEQGFVKPREDVIIYAPIPGKVTGVFAEEKKQIKKGDIICTVDSSQLDYEKAQTLSSIASYEAQITNLDLEEKRQKDSLVYNKQSLQSDLSGLVAQEKSSDMTKGEQIRLQNILVSQSGTDLANAESDLVKGKTLYDSGLMPKNEYDQLAKAVKTYESALEGQKQQLEIIKTGQAQTSPEYFESVKNSLRAQIKGIDNSLSKSYTSAMKSYYRSLIEGAKASITFIDKKIADCSVKSPVEGEITKLEIKNVNVINAGMPVATISFDAVNEIEVNVSTKDIDTVKIGDTVGLILKRQSGDVNFTGKIVKVDDNASVNVSALGVSERRVLVTVMPDASEGAKLESGYDVDIKFVTYRAENVLLVPKTAVFKDSTGVNDMVWTVENGLAVMRQVKLGKELRTEYVVESGLTENSIVIKDVDTTGLKEGAKIKID